MDRENGVLTEQLFHFDFLNALSEAKGGNEKIKTCIQCGSCTGSCVAAEGQAMNPRKLWRSLQLGMESEVMESMHFWSCTTCGLCDKRCPRGIPMSQIMISLREKHDREGGVIAGVSQTADNLARSRNITGDDPQNRFLWLDNLGLSAGGRKSLFKEQTETAYFVGCVGALFPQVGAIPQSFVKLLLKKGADFSLLEDEWCCGYPVLAGGKGMGGVAEYALHNIAEIERKGAKQAVVSCPTCCYMFTKVYADAYGKPLPFKVLHYTEYLGELGVSGGGADAAPAAKDATAPKAAPADKEAKGVAVTYHDPCDLGRKLHLTDPARRLLKGLPGVDFREMRFAGEEAKCCGGGGNMEMVNPELSQSIAARRIAEAVETGAEYVLSSCQQCKRTLQNAARKSRARIKVADLLEFMLMRLEEAGKEAGQ